MKRPANGDQPRAKRLKQKRENILNLAPEIQLLILQNCEGVVLARVEQVCKLLSTPIPALSLVQRAIRSQLFSKYKSTSLNTKSWAINLCKIEEAHEAGRTWEGKVALAECEDLGNKLLRAERVRICTMKLLARMPTETIACTKVIMDFCRVDRDSVVAAGALPVLARLLRSPACVYAARAIWAINKGSKYQSEVNEAGAIGPLVAMLKAGSRENQLIACRTLFRLTHGLHPSAKAAASSVIAAGAAGQVVQLLRQAVVDGKGAKVAASLLCCLSCNVSIHCEVLAEAGAIAPLVALMETGPDDARAYAGQSLVDMAARRPALQLALAPIFYRLLESGQRRLDWFDLARALGILVWRSRLVASSVEVGPLLASLLAPEGFTSSNAESCVVMGIASIGSIDVVPVAERLVSALETSDCEEVNMRIARTLAAIARKSLRGTSEAFHATGLLELGGDVISRMLPPLVHLLREGTNRAKKHGADCLGCIANERAYIDLVAYSGAVPLLISILRGHATNDVKQYAAMAIGNIASIGTHARTVVKMGGLEPLMQLLEVDCELDGGEFAVMAISNLTFDTDCMNAMLKFRIVELLLRLVYPSVPAPHPGRATLREWRVAFTSAWAVVALLAIDSSSRNQQVMDTFTLEACSADMKSELARALLETIEKQGRLLQGSMTAALLDELASDSAHETAAHAKEAKHKLLNVY